MQEINSAEQDTQQRLIWTPRFILVFALVLLLGLSLASLFTQSWLASIYPPLYVFWSYLVVALMGWLVLAFRTRSGWLRLGAGLACIWSIAMGLKFWVDTLGLDPQTALIADVNTASNCLLLATFICLSIAYTPLRTWDLWLFRALPLLGCAIVLLITLLTPADVRTQIGLEGSISAVALAFSVAVWWLRPSCWQLQPGPTFIFGLVPLLLLLTSLPAFASGGDAVFASQLPLLCILLGILRLFAGERVS
jgi:hypothetical protein